MLRALRSLGFARGSIVLALAITTWFFTLMARAGEGERVLVAIVVEVALIAFVQAGLTRRERVWFSVAAVVLGLLALAAGTLAAG